MPMIQHVVLVKWKEGVSKKDIEKWVELCNRIPDECPMVYNWSSGYSIAGPDPTKPSSHAFGLHFDLRSGEEWGEYLTHPYPSMVYNEALKVIDLEHTASVNILVDAEAGRKSSRILDRHL